MGIRPAVRGSRPSGPAIMAANDSQPPLALRPRDAARMLGVSERTLWGWTKAGIVPCVRIGIGKRKTVLYPVADLQGWLARRAADLTGGEHDPR